MAVQSHLVEPVAPLRAMLIVKSTPCCRPWIIVIIYNSEYYATREDFATRHVRVAS